MLYHILTALGENFPLYNLIQSITFRAVAASVSAIAFALLVGPWVIRRLRARNVGQVVRADGPEWHHAKAGTPTMGGVIILVGALVPTLLWARLDNRFILVAVVATMWMGVIGFIDDYLKVVEGKSRGLVARYKLAGQVMFGVGLGTYLLLHPLPGSLASNETTVPFLKYTTVYMAPVVYVGFITLIVTGMSNAVNLTDGLDGLAGGLTVVAGGAFAVVAYLFGNSRAAEYLLVYYLPGTGELSIFCACITGAALGFLWFNSHPAEVFMGDTGSLAIGGAFGTVAILLKSEFLLLMVGGVFVAEAASVVLQTGVFRWRKRRHGVEYARAHRVFRMAPLHHHFEKKGWAESKVVARFYIVGIVCALLGLVATLKIR